MLIQIDIIPYKRRSLFIYTYDVLIHIFDFKIDFGL